MVLICVQDSSCLGVELQLPGMVDDVGLAALALCKKLRVVHLNAVGLSAQSLAVRSQRVRWLGADKVGTPEDLHLQLCRISVIIPSDSNSGVSPSVHMGHLCSGVQLQWPDPQCAPVLDF
jgi:hypothetical protein